MTHLLRLPYYTPRPDRISIGEWNLKENSDTYPLGELLPAWDPAMLIQAVVPVHLDLLGILEDCRLPADARLRLAALWESPGTMLRGCSQVIDLNHQHHGEQLYLHLDIQGTYLAGSLDLITCLVLSQSGRTEQPFAPKLPGSILARKIQTVILEGEGARFPVEILDFAQTHYPSAAGWVLYWDPENLHQTVLGDTRLYINAGHKRVQRAISGNQSEDYGIREAVRLDVARILIMGALNSEEFVENPDVYAQGSVGAAIRTLLRLYFPDMPLTQLRDNSKHPQSFEPKLQDRLKAFWGE
jgi:hypothetical protein